MPACRNSGMSRVLGRSGGMSARHWVDLDFNKPKKCEAVMILHAGIEPVSVPGFGKWPHCEHLGFKVLPAYNHSYV